MIAIRISDSNAEIFIYEVKALHENIALHEMKILFSFDGRWLKTCLILILRSCSLGLILTEVHFTPMSMKLKRLPSLVFYKARFTLPQAVRHCSSLSSSNQAGCAQLCIWSIVSEFFCIENRLSHDLRGGVTPKELDDLLYLYRNVVSCLPDGLVHKLAHF